MLLITDPTFAAGVVSQKHHVHGTLKGGQGISAVTVEYVQNEETVDQGEWFLASGEDGIFPRGIPVGQATTVRQGRNHKEIFVTPSGLQNGLEDVLIVIDGVHGTIPEHPSAGPARASVWPLQEPMNPAPTRRRRAARISLSWIARRKLRAPSEKRSITSLATKTLPHPTIISRPRPRLPLARLARARLAQRV